MLIKLVSQRIIRGRRNFVCSFVHTAITFSVSYEQFYSSPRSKYFSKKKEMAAKQKTIVIGAGPVGSLAAIYAAQRGHDVEVYEFRNGMPRDDSF
jgi:NADPH-dependent glutamate synthase beta subunit-like oxidoreductase